MLNRFQTFGKDAETIAAKYLKKAGYKILEKNYRSGGGEIDLIAKDKNTIVFVEVKARKSDRYGHPKEAVTYRKQRKISMTALSYLKETKQENKSARFDVVAMIIKNDKTVIEVIKNAFECCV